MLVPIPFFLAYEDENYLQCNSLVFLAKVVFQSKDVLCFLGIRNHIVNWVWLLVPQRRKTWRDERQSVIWPVCWLKDDDVSLHEEAVLSLLSPVLSCSQVYSCWRHPPRRDLPSPYKYQMQLSFSLSLTPFWQITVQWLLRFRCGQFRFRGT